MTTDYGNTRLVALFRTVATTKRRNLASILHAKKRQPPKIAQDNMTNRRIVGNRNGKVCDTVLAVPHDADLAVELSLERGISGNYIYTYINIYLSI